MTAACVIRLLNPVYALGAHTVILAYKKALVMILQALPCKNCAASTAAAARQRASAFAAVVSVATTAAHPTRNACAGHRNGLQGSSACRKLALSAPQLLLKEQGTGAPKLQTPHVPVSTHAWTPLTRSAATRRRRTVAQEFRPCAMPIVSTTLPSRNGFHLVVVH
jgi:hypothetical protein